MRILAITLGCLPFVLLETGLRVAGVPAVRTGIDTDPVVDLHQLRPLFELTADSSQYVIPESRRNFFQPAAFPAEKRAAVRRVFVLGGSTVQGRPYATETAFAKWLELRLQASDPDTTYEVVNCGGVSYASYRVSRILDEVLGYQADAIVLYTGHNEFLEDRSYAHVRDLSEARSLISQVGSHIQTVRWLKSFGRGSEIRTLLPTEVDARLDDSDGLAGYQRDPEWKAQVENHFAVTLRRMIDAARRAKVPMIVCVPASDLVNTPPIKSAELKSLSAAELGEFQSHWKQARDDQADPNDRLSAAKECLRIDPHHAAANYITGRLLYAMGDETYALAYLTTARDHDVCPLRATGSILHAVRTIAMESNVPLVETINLLDQRSQDGTRISDGIVDPEYFVDHVHPTIAGHQLIAKAIAEQFQTLGWITLDDRTQQRYADLAQEHLATLGEEYFARGKQRLEGLRLWASGRAGQLGLSP